MNDMAAAPPRLLQGLDLKLLAAAVLVLAVALLSVNFGFFSLAPWRTVDFYLNYSLGFVQRGIVGALYQLFNGPPTAEGIQAFNQQFGPYRISSMVIAFWVLLMVPLARGRVPRELRWLLFAFTALLLVAPVWRFQNFDRSLDPLYTFFAVLALVCLVRNRPLLFIVPCFIGHLIHPQMLIWDALLCVLVLHACFTSERHFAKWRWWLGACVLLFLLSALLYFLNDPVRSVELMRSLGYGPPAALEGATRDYLSPGTSNHKMISALWSGHPRYQLTVVAVYLGLMLVPAMLVGFCCAGRWRRRLLAHRFASWGLARWAIRNDFYLLMLAGAVCFLPVQLTSFDWQRLILLGFWGMAIALAYLLAMPSARDVGGESVEASGQLLLRRLATACIAVLAYAFSGMSVISTGTLTSIHECREKCVVFLTDSNPLGERLGDAIFQAVVNRALPLQLDAAAIHKKSWRLHSLEVKDGTMVVPDGQDIELIHHHISALSSDPKGTFKLLATMEYDSPSPPQLVTVFSNAELFEYDSKRAKVMGEHARMQEFTELQFDPVSISDTQANWELDVSKLFRNAAERRGFDWRGEMLFQGRAHFLAIDPQGLRVRSFRLEMLEN